MPAPRGSDLPSGPLSLSRSFASIRGCSATSAFTLIELLAVVAIMGIVMAITVVGFTNIGKAAAIRGGTNSVRAAISLARQYAVTKRVPTAFVVMDVTLFDDYSPVPALVPLAGRSYAVIDLKHKAYLQAWEELPQGVVFNHEQAPPAGEGNNILDHANRLSSPDAIRVVPFPTSSDQADLRDLYGIMFTPDGRCVEKPGGGTGRRFYHWVVLSEGIKNDAGIILKQPSTTFGLRVSKAGSVKTEEL